MLIDFVPYYQIAWELGWNISANSTRQVVTSLVERGHSTMDRTELARNAARDSVLERWNDGRAGVLWNDGTTGVLACWA